jgi:hypothetical protein
VWFNSLVPKVFAKPLFSRRKNGVEVMTPQMRYRPADH